MRPMNLGPWCLDLRRACEANGMVLHSNPPGDLHWDYMCSSCDVFPKSELESLPEYNSVMDSSEDSLAGPDLDNYR